MSKYLMFSDDQLAKFAVFARSLKKNPHAGAHDAKLRLRRRAHDQELPPHIAKELENEGKGPGHWSIQRLCAVVREMYGKPAADAIRDKIRERWPLEMKSSEEKMSDHHREMLDENENDEDAEDDEQESVAEEPLGEEAEDETELERATERRLQNRKSDMRFVTEDDPPRPTTGGPPPTKGMPSNFAGGRKPNSPHGRVAGDAKSYAQRFPDAARIDADPPRRAGKIIEDRKTKRKAFLAMDSKSKNSYSSRFPDAAKIKAI
jgi:hypothetical protein